MNIFGQFDKIATIFERLKYTSTIIARLSKIIYKGNPTSNSWPTRIAKYIANSSVTSFLTSSNFSHGCTIFTAITAYGSVAVAGQGIPLVVVMGGAICAAVAINGHNLYKHKQMVKADTVLNKMLIMAKANQSSLSNQSIRTKLAEILPEGQCKKLKNPKFSPEPKPASTLQMAVFRGVSTPSMAVSSAAALISFNPVSIACSALAGAVTLIGGSFEENDKYNRKVKFVNSIESARYQLGCVDIASTAQLYKRLVAEKATIAAIKQGKSVTECKKIYNKVLTETIPPIRKATKMESLKGHLSNSGTAIYYGFSSKAYSNLYLPPEPLKKEMQPTKASKSKEKARTPTKSFATKEKKRKGERSTQYKGI